MLAEALERQGWSVWWDSLIDTGESFRTAIENELNIAKCVIVLWSSHSIESVWVIDEASMAAEREILVPLLIEDVKIPFGYGFRQIQTGWLTDWQADLPHREFEKLKKRVADLINRDRTVAASEQKATESTPITHGLKRPSLLRRLTRTTRGVPWLVVSVLSLAVVVVIAYVVYTRYVVTRSNPGAVSNKNASNASEVINANENKAVSASKVSKGIMAATAFTHAQTPEHHQRCDVCHQGLDNRPSIRFPTHSSCLQCHLIDFTTSSSQLCGLCHTMPVAAEGALISFPNKLREFGLREFSHRLHRDLDKMPAGSSVPRCNSCHTQIAKNKLSVPDHPACYQCHTAQAGNNIGSCGNCHLYGEPLPPAFLVGNLNNPSPKN